METLRRDVVRAAGTVACGAVLALTGVAAAGGLTWATAVDHLASDDGGTSELRSLALAAQAGNASIYLGYIQTSSGTRDVHRHSTVPPYAFLDDRGDSVAQPKGIATDDRGYVYVGNREGGGSFAAVVHVHDAALNLLSTFNFSTSEFGGIAVQRSGDDYYLYLSRESGGEINRYIATDPFDIVPDTNWGSGGSFVIPSGGILRGLEVADDGTIFVTNRDPGTVHRVSADLSSVVSVSVPRAMDVALFDGRVYVSSYNGAGSLIRVLDMDDLSFIDDIAITDLDGSPYVRGTAEGFAGIDIDANGRIWLCDEHYAGTGSSTRDRLLVSSAMTAPGLALHSDQSCVANIGDTVTVTIELAGNGDAEVVGGQFLLWYDASTLQFVSAEPGSGADGPGLFSFEVYESDPHVPGLLDYAVGVLPPNPGTTGDATMAVLTFQAIGEACDVAGLVGFRPSSPFVTRLTDAVGGAIDPDLSDLHAITIDATAPEFTTFPADTSVECGPTMVRIAGTHAVPDSSVNPSFGNYRPFKIETGALFQPIQGPVTVTGSVDISTLPNNSSVFVGIIAKPQYEAWLAAGIPGADDPNDSVNGFFGFLDTAYGAFNTLAGGRTGLGQQLSFGDTTQTIAASGVGPAMSGFELEFDATEMRLTYGAFPTKHQAYQTAFDYISWYFNGGPATAAGNPIPTDWSDGAYAFVGTFFDKLGGAPEIDVTFAQQGIPDPSETDTPTAVDGCGGTPAITYADEIIAGSCAETFVIERTWTATDECGNSVSQVQTITIVDTTDPVLVDVPANVQVPADAGSCSAVVAITPPTAVDNCDPNPVVTAARSDGMALAAPFPVGSTTITWTATDCAGNTGEAATTVTVDPFHVVDVSVSLQAMVDAGPFTRCVTFEFMDVSGTTVLATVSQELAFEHGAATGTITVPCGLDLGDCVTARDPLHTLRSTGVLALAGTEYVASGFAPLRGGDLNDDGMIDVLDYGVYVWQYGVTYPDGGSTTCATPYPHADITGDGGPVGLDDVSFIIINFFKVDESCASMLMARAGDPAAPKPRASVSLRELRALGLGHLAVADLNGDGVVDTVDIAQFTAQGHP